MYNENVYIVSIAITSDVVKKFFLPLNTVTKISLFWFKLKNKILRLPFQKSKLLFWYKDNIFLDPGKIVKDRESRGKKTKISKIYLKCDGSSVLE